jgi:hypothetical protein
MKCGATLAAGVEVVERLFEARPISYTPLKNFEKLRKSQPFINLQAKLCITFNVII